jgi:acetolactate synthase small subunit
MIYKDMKTVFNRIKEMIPDSMVFYELDPSDIKAYEAEAEYVNDIKSLMEMIYNIVDRPTIEEVRVEQLVKRILVMAISKADKEHKKEIEKLLKNMEDES